jgi:hypothetical protein
LDELLPKIKQSIPAKNVKFSSHAKKEMETEEYGEIHKNEVYESILNGEVIEKYKDDKPYPSCLISGKTYQGRPIHTVCAFVEEEDLTVIITVYEPDPSMWIKYKKRK